MSVKPTYEYYTIVTTSGNVTKSFDDYYINASANLTLTLPSASSTGLKGKIFTFRRVDSLGSAVTVTIAANGSDTIGSSGVSSFVIDDAHVVKLMRYSTTSWQRIMETKKAFTTAIYSGAGTNNLDPSVDVAQLNTASNLVTLTLPAANSIGLGARYYVTTTSAANTGQVSPSGFDTINGTGALVSVAVNTNKCFFTTSNASPGAWRQM